MRLEQTAEVHRMTDTDQEGREGLAINSIIRERGTDTLGTPTFAGITLPADQREQEFIDKMGRKDEGGIAEVEDPQAAPPRRYNSKPRHL